ncbi:hypothetical protein [Modicisalibacter radicis]|uniref:hypothetical protein n=1 Tax=Halomonas sp. EAR18 TaxID=2518972 RepID=UPI00109D06DF|nr:hypothetical protein [Halomonas sp. EAR18]
MSIFLRMVRDWVEARRAPLPQWSSWALAMLGSVSFCVAGYWGLIIKAVLGDLIQATNDAGITLMALAMWGLFGMLGVAFWFHGCIAARCHLVLFERHF